MDPCFLSFFQNIAQSFFVIYDWLCICHTHNGSKTAFCSSCCSCVDILFVGQSRITEMDMDIYQSRCYHKTFCIDHLVCSCFCLCWRRRFLAL